ncbi:Kinase superfamily protein isoform 1 [Hibiscus syriacus]|uniref:Kinase superfamily protein isoform 1 n=1 Tax=Hibiscus syriacus TaxID=106335 RepID=A0A6A2ZVC3_HIBSY|nr:Kinase superfamily protein isoform 1 [Hibiscus syriacus]
MAAQNQTDLFDGYFRKADLDVDGHISGAEAVAFFQGSSLPKQVLAQVWMYADQKKLGYLGRQEFYNALKLVTVAQSKRDLTPDMVKAALYGPASARIPAPQINVATTPAPHPSVATVTSQSSGNTSVPFQNSALNGAPGLGNVGVNQQYAQPLQNQIVRPPQAMSPVTSSQIQPALAAEAVPRGDNMVAPLRLPTSNSSTNLQSGSSGGFTTSVNNQAQNLSVSPSAGQGSGLTDSGLTPSMQPIPQATPVQISSSAPKPQDSSIPPNQLAPGDSKASVVSGNGFASDSLFGDVFSTASSQSKQTSLATTSSATGSIVPMISVPASGPHPSAKSSPAESLQGTISQQPVDVQYHPGHPTWRQNQQAAGQNSAASRSAGFAEPGNLSSGQSTQSQPPWPKMTQSDKQKYLHKLTLIEMEKLLVQSVLKLQASKREGRPLPSVLPSTLVSDETPSTSGHLPVPHRNVAWGPAHVFLQPQATAAPRPPLPSTRGRPPRPVSVSQTDAQMPPAPQKSKVPVLEKNLVDQLSQEEQDSLNSRFKEATDANKKAFPLLYGISGVGLPCTKSVSSTSFFAVLRDVNVEELEKEIQDSRAKTEFFRAKMQELVEALAKKYEEKYRLSGDVASRLTIEESTFRDIQEKKMELYQAIVKIEQGDNKDGALQEHANQIQTSLEELMKSLNERCKQYGLRAKPTSLVELPFGWQSGIQEGAADWDEDWDKFEDEGFTFVKELTLDVQNVIAPPKPKSSLVQKETASAISDKDIAIDQSEDGLAKSPSGKPAITTDKQSQEFQDSHGTSSGADGSPHAKKTDDIYSSALAKESRSDQGGAESLFLEDKSFDEPIWGNLILSLKIQFRALTMNMASTPANAGDMIHGKSLSIFADSVPSTPAYADNMFKGKSSSLFADSVPSTPAYADNMFKGQSSSLFADSVPSTPAYADNMFKGQSSSLFADSVPSTPAYADNMFKGQSSSLYADSVPSTPAYADNMFKSQSSSLFTDSIPSTPAYADNMFKGKGSSPFMDCIPSTSTYHYSKQSFGEGSEAYSFDSFSRSDSFNMQDSGLFQSRTFDRFDSMRSSTDFDQGYGFPPSRFDSFNSRDQPDKSLTRFDSVGSTAGFDHSREFASFDDNDPFGSTGPFRTSLESQTLRRDSDKWSAF